MSMVKLTRQQIEKMIENHSGLDLSGLDLSGLDLSGLDLSGANLSGAKLYKANLLNTNLSKANFNGADVSGVTFNSETKWPDGFMEAHNRAAHKKLENNLVSTCEELGMNRAELSEALAAFRAIGIRPQQLRMELKELARSESSSELFLDKESQSYRLWLLVNALTLELSMQGAG